MMKKHALLIKNIASWLVALTFALSVFAPARAADAAPGPETPLFPGLTWQDGQPQEQEIAVTEGTALLPGTSFSAVESVNLDAEDSQALLEFYNDKSLALAGWQAVAASNHESGYSNTYFHTDGYYLRVAFSACESDSALACLTIWMSEATNLQPAPAARPETTENLGTLSKTTPVNNATNVNNANVTLKWSAYTGTGLNRYRYCIDTSNNNQCDAAGEWTNAWGNTSVTLTTLAANTTYYWQVQAVLNDNTKVDANSGAWWTFSTQVTLPPAAFNKLLPANGAVNQSITPVLTWQSSPTAASYSYCVDTINNGLCDNSWINAGTNTMATLMTGIANNTTYYWQVRATNANGTTNADSGWFSFTTGTPLPNDFLETATTISVPYLATLNTIPATIDAGTENTCSPGAGFASVWYKYTPAASGKLYLDTLGSNYDTFIAVWRQNTPSNTLVACNDDAYSTKQSDVNVAVTAATTYYIQIGHRNGNTAPTVTPGGTLKVQVRSFQDVLGNNPFWTNIESVRQAGITDGCAVTPERLYCPNGTVSRAQMSIFLLKGIHGAAYTPPAVGASTGFGDVATTYWAAAWIKQLATEGITGGCGDGSNFCPESPVTRAQMAVFLLKAKHGAAYVPPSAGASTGFTDVPTSYWAADWIKQLAAEGITGGCGGGNYCPNNPVTRAQMAVFLVNTFSLPLFGAP
jgi:hypothetical protein